MTANREVLLPGATDPVILRRRPLPMLQSIRFLNRQWTIPLLFTLPALVGISGSRGLAPPMETTVLFGPMAVLELDPSL